MQGGKCHEFESDLGMSESETDLEAQKDASDDGEASFISVLNRDGSRVTRRIERRGTRGEDARKRSSSDVDSPTDSAQQSPSTSPGPTDVDVIYERAWGKSNSRRRRSTQEHTHARRAVFENRASYSGVSGRFSGEPAVAVEPSPDLEDGGVDRDDTRLEIIYRSSVSCQSPSKPWVRSAPVP